MVFPWRLKPWWFSLFMAFKPLSWRSKRYFSSKRRAKGDDATRLVEYRTLAFAAGLVAAWAQATESNDRALAWKLSVVFFGAYRLLF